MQYLVDFDEISNMKTADNFLWKYEAVQTPYELNILCNLILIMLKNKDFCIALLWFLFMSKSHRAQYKDLIATKAKGLEEAVRFYSSNHLGSSVN